MVMEEIAPEKTQGQVVQRQAQLELRRA